jgi:hypothetical protein
VADIEPLVWQAKRVNLIRNDSPRKTDAGARQVAAHGTDWLPVVFTGQAGVGPSNSHAHSRSPRPPPRYPGAPTGYCRGLGATTQPLRRGSPPRQLAAGAPRKRRALILFKPPHIYFHKKNSEGSRPSSYYGQLWRFYTGEGGVFDLSYTRYFVEWSKIIFSLRV